MSQAQKGSAYSILCCTVTVMEFLIFEQGLHVFTFMSENSVADPAAGSSCGTRVGGVGRFLL